MAGAAVGQVLAGTTDFGRFQSGYLLIPPNSYIPESKSALDRATTVKAILDKAHLSVGDEKSSKELGMRPTAQKTFLRELLTLHNPPLDEFTIGEACNLCRATTKEGSYVWVSTAELIQLS